MGLPFPDDVWRPCALYKAKLAQKIGDNMEVINQMSKIAANSSTDLSREERLLFFNGYKKNLLPLRVAWTALSSEEVNVDVEDNFSRTAKAYKAQKQAEMSEQCLQILEILHVLLLKAESAECYMLYSMVSAEMLSYISEMKVGEGKEIAVEKCCIAYKHLQDQAALNFLPTHPICLQLAINLSLYLEGLGALEEAFEVANKAYLDALAVDEPLGDHSSRLLQSIFEIFLRLVGSLNQ